LTVLYPAPTAVKQGANPSSFLKFRTFSYSGAAHGFSGTNEWIYFRI